MTKADQDVRTALSRNQVAVTGAFRAPRRRHTVVKDASSIDYTPEKAIDQAMKMLGSQQDVLKLVVFRSALRPAALQRAANELVGVVGSTKNH